MALNGVNPYDVARNGPAAAGAAGAAQHQPALPAAGQAAAMAAEIPLLERPAAPAPAVSQSPPLVSRRSLCLLCCSLMLCQACAIQSLSHRPAIMGIETHFVMNLSCTT